MADKEKVISINEKVSTNKRVSMNENDPNDDLQDEISLSIQTEDLKRMQSVEDDTPKFHLPRKTRRSKASRIPKPTRWQKFKAAVGGYFQRVWDAVYGYLQGVFTLTIVRGDPISFCRAEDFNAAGDLMEESDEEYENAMDLVEAACNYSEKTKGAFERLIMARKEFAENKMKAKDIEWGQLAPWNESFLGHLEGTFHVFDSTGDDLIDWDEMNIMLLDFNDKTPEEERLQVFKSADTGAKGALTFTEFIKMFHNITVKSPESYPSTIVDTFRSIDRNMARIRGLDVVQQLQAGLF